MTPYRRLGRGGIWAVDFRKNHLKLCRILRLKCSKIDFGWAYSAPPELDLRGLLLRGGEGREGKEKGREGSKGPPPCSRMGPRMVNLALCVTSHLSRVDMR